MKVLINFIHKFLQRPVVKKFSGAMFTQGMLSLANFMVGILVVKYAAKSEYGMYVILFSIIGILGNYQNALVNTPLTVLAPKKESAEKCLFFSGLGLGQWLLFLPLIIFAIIIVTIYSFIHHDFTMLKYVLALSIAISTFLLREFIRTVNYSNMRIHLIVKMDMVFVFFVALGMGILVVFDNVTSSFAITVLGIGYFLAAVFGYFSAGDIYTINWNSIKNSFRETWEYSRWALVGVTSDIFKNRGFIYVASAFLGLEKVAEISAARLFLMPVGLFVASSGKVTLAKGAEILNTKGVDRFKKFIFLTSSFLIIVWMSYVLGLWFFFDFLISFFGEKYKNIEGLVLLWGILFIIYVLRYSVTNALIVCKEFKVLAKYDVISAIVVIILCLILTKTSGSSGVVISLIVGESLTLLLATPRLLMFFKKYNNL